MENHQRLVLRYSLRAVSWKFRTLDEGMKWAFTNKVAHEVANDNGIWG
ncbi:hypothetical protein H0C22_001539 [Salmonella enterica]|nr:hypothetical protein [Salmonella enterica]EFS5263592.1 hypothetical protein [Salmonella enterica]EFT4167724.1 hypothetical protein [Salmonella enterica]EGD2388532.1 hypothetical protein [Salmonella enterica]EGH3247968.1 hypothetical protein [Salmonella enterica]